MTRLAQRLVLAALLAGCGGEGNPIDPLSTGRDDDAGPPIADAGHDGSAEGGVRRTVEQRNPFGNVAEHENLLWDGDFEWSSVFADQYGWINYPAAVSGFGFEGIKVGVECRSGLKCAAIAKGATIIGIAVSSKVAALSASFWAKPTIASCDGISARLIAIAVNDPGVDVPATTAAPDAAGWCRFETSAARQTSKTYLLIKNESDGEVIVDDAVLKKVPPTQGISPGEAKPPTAARLAEDAAVRALVRQRGGPHDAPPGPAQRAFEAWAKR